MNKVDYRLLCDQLRSLAEGEPHWLPVLSNASALIYEILLDLNWAGFYLTDATTQGPSLILGPFQGKVACTRIAYGRGVCGTAAQTDQSQLVPNVHLFAGHIACDSASQSEVVIPIHASGEVIGVLDIDSPLLARFGEDDLAGLTLFVKALEEVTGFVGLPLA